MNIHRVVNAANDTVRRFFATKFPLKNVANDIGKERNLNARERKALFDLVFRFSRESYLINAFLKKHFRFLSSMSTGQLHALIIDLLQFDAHPSLASLETKQLHAAYSLWLHEIRDERSLLALSPFVKDQLVMRFGEEARNVAASLLLRPKNYLAIDTRHMSVDAVRKALAELQISSTTHPFLNRAIGIDQDFNIADLPTGIREHVWVMDAGSQIVAELVKPAAHEEILDMCTGTGNKARYITQQPCHYLACDIDENRLNKAKLRINEPGLRFMHADARKNLGLFDWILLDAPCTGVGVLRRHPDLMHRINRSDLDTMIELQQQLLTSAVQMLKPNGKLIYATCSLFQDENDSQIKRVLTKNDQILPCVFSEIVGVQLKLPQGSLTSYSLMLTPNIHDCDGFYLACLRKIASDK